MMHLFSIQWTHWFVASVFFALCTILFDRLHDNLPFGAFDVFSPLLFLLTVVFGLATLVSIVIGILQFTYLYMLVS